MQLQSEVCRSPDLGKSVHKGLKSLAQAGPRTLIRPRWTNRSYVSAADCPKWSDESALLTFEKQSWRREKGD